MNLANIIIAKRREKGVTQDELATHVGVSKASVSKWENGNAFPDILLLPIIAEYFAITIDQLMNHSPQLSEAEIVKIYTRLIDDFSNKPFEGVIEECDALAKRHYTCFPFLKYVSLLYINHASMAKTAERKTQIFRMAIDLCEHTLQNCREPNLLQMAAHLQATCYLSTGQPEKVLELLCDENQMPLQYGIGNSALVSQAHQLLQNMDKANEVEQIELYQNLMNIFDGMLSYLRLNLSHYETALPVYERAKSIAKTFNIRRLNPNSAAILYTFGAHMYQAAGESEKALDTLAEFVDVCIHGFFPIMARGDSFFDKVDQFLSNQYAPPRNETVVKEHMLNDILLDPAFDSLHDKQEFTILVQKMINLIGGK